MLLLFNVNRRLARLAADASQIEAAALIHGRPWCRTDRDRSTSTPRPGATGRTAASIDNPRLSRALEIAIVGRADQLCEALTADASGWSPTLSFSSRLEAEDALRDEAASLTVNEFHINGLWETGSRAFAEWQVEATLVTPLLIGDDVLIEPCDNRVVLNGGTVVNQRHGLLSVIHTYFDDAALIEQVLLNS